MSELHAALKSLAPTDWTSVPTADQQISEYLGNVFSDTELIVNSVPIVPAEENATQTKTSIAPATKAAEISVSSARHGPIPTEHEKLQKEWGKPIKLKASENQLGMSVYKCSGKDGKGSWFARRSVHEGIGFAKFKKSLEQEFPQTMTEEGPPGTGNIRGIGGEQRIECIQVPGRGKVEVYRLSAQFPGPTTPRDFVTLFITSDQSTHSERSKPAPRTYIMISKPCNHPDTQPQGNFIRGQYESVEFIREIPRKLKTSQSSDALNNLAAKKTAASLREDVLLHNAQHRAEPTSASLSVDAQDSSSGRPRSSTSPPLPNHGGALTSEGHDPEANPVEWIMVTRSDPGGSVPKFMVERGTPSSICADAVKFLDWACAREFEDEITPMGPLESESSAQMARRGSHQSWRSKGLAGIEEHNTTHVEAKGASKKAVLNDQSTPGEQPVVANQPDANGVPTMTDDDNNQYEHGLWGTVSGIAASFKPYTPQAVLDRLPQGEQQADLLTTTAENVTLSDSKQDDARSTTSTTSFASAEDHLSSSEDNDSNSHSSKASSSTFAKSNTREVSASVAGADAVNEATTAPKTHHEKELVKLQARQDALQTKFAQSQVKQNQAGQKATEKHDKEVKKQEEKYQKELEKLEKRQAKEKRKIEQKARKQNDKDERQRLTRERDEARAETDALKQETNALKEVIQELQKVNNILAMKLGKVTVGISPSLSDKELQVLASGDGSTTSRHRSSSFNRLIKKKEKDAANPSGLGGVVGSSQSVKSGGGGVS